MDKKAICKYCGKKIEENINGFCDEVCQGKYYGEKSKLIDYGKGICQNCGKEFKKKTKNQIYCSKKCGDKIRHERYYKHTEYILTCKTCGKKFKSNRKNVKYCSSECRNKLNVYICERCGKKFKAKNKRKYCSDECRKKPILKKKCAYCGNEFTTKKEEQKYCSIKCCGLDQRKSHEEFMKELIKAHNGTIVPLEIYKGSDDKLKCKCLKCGGVMNKIARAYINKKSHGCKKCNNKSHGETKVAEVLDKLEIDYIEQYVIEEVKYKNSLLFDFALFNKEELIAIIEYDGEQHFKPVETFGGKESFKKTKARDKIKNKYCLLNNIPILRISYTEKNIETYLKTKFKELEHTNQLKVI